MISGSGLASLVINGTNDASFFVEYHRVSKETSKHNRTICAYCIDIKHNKINHDLINNEVIIFIHNMRFRLVRFEDNRTMQLDNLVIARLIK